MTPPARKPESDYSIRLSLDIRGREKPTVWPWVIVVLVTLVVGSPFLGRLIDRLL